MRTLGISRACADRTGPGFGYRYHVIFVQQEMIGKPDAIKTGFFSLRAKRSSRHSPLRVGPETKPQSTSVLVNSQKNATAQMIRVLTNLIEASKVGIAPKFVEMIRG